MFVGDGDGVGVGVGVTTGVGVGVEVCVKADGRVTIMMPTTNMDKTMSATLRVAGFMVSTDALFEGQAI